jgi:AcrR family transcriptional regulator
MAAPTFEQDLARVIANAIKTAIRPVEDRLKALEPGAPASTPYGLSEFARDLATDTKGFVTAAIAAAVAPLQQRIEDLEAALTDPERKAR